MPDRAGFRQRLLRWYAENARDLPWRRHHDPWQILVSEIMLQQTRVEAVLPYYERFLSRFPDAAALATAPEASVLAAWSGLGYYSRARNLQKCARLVAGGFPSDYDSIRALPGVGPYTAAAVSSIGFNLPFAAVDGNVLRVIARVTSDAGDIGLGVTRQRITGVAEQLLDPVRPGDFNQAMMELGATTCAPRAPRCLVCPVTQDCLARQQGLQNQLPVKRPKAAPDVVECAVIVVRRRSRILLRQRPQDASRMAGFWELPLLNELPGAPALKDAGEFQHTIVNTRYRVRVHIAAPMKTARIAGWQWFANDDLVKIPLTTMTRKALSLLDSS